MGIIRDQELIARKAHLNSLETPADPVAQALLDLQARKTSIVDALTASAREHFIKTGRLEAAADIHAESSMYLVDEPTAAKLIKQWMREVDSSLTASVRVVGDYSGNLNYAAQIVVLFSYSTEQLLRDAILSRLAEIIEDVTGIEPEEVLLEKSFVDDLEVDSLSMVEIVVQAEDKYGITIPNEHIAGLRTVNEAVQYAVNIVDDNPEAAYTLTEDLNDPLLASIIHTYIKG